MIISELNKIDISAKIDQTKKDFRNDGHSLTYHANSYEISFYDKRKDLEQAKKYGEKRSIEKDNSAQLPLLGRMAFDPLEVFRIEYGLNQKRVMKQMLEKYGFESDLKFKSLFKKEFSKQLLIGVWQLFDSKFDFTVHNVEDPVKLLDSVFKAKPELSLLKALAYTEAFRIASSGEGGMRRFREAIEKHSNIRSWHRIKTQLKGVKLSPDRTKLEALIQVGKQLERFEPVNIKDYPQLKICDVNNS